MAFLNKAALQKTVETMQVADHPLLKNGDIPMNVKQAYVQGCVLATLMDDEKISDDERAAVRKIGKSLRLDDVAIQECFDVILGLQSQDDKLACLNEVISAIGSGDARFYFMIDFEQLLCLRGVPNEDGYGILDYIGKGLFKNEDWRRDVIEFERESITADAAKRYLVAAEQTGNKWDCFVAGRILFNGHGVPKDEEGAFELMLKAADLGAAAAQRQVGLWYLVGRCVKKDERVATQWLQKAALAGDKIGQAAWGRCLFDGTGVAQDMSGAVKWFVKAAEAGEVEAQVRLADCYRMGQGIQADGQLAVKWYSKAIDQDDADALVGLGKCYEEGIGVPQDCAKAVDCYMQAAQKGTIAGCYYMGTCCKDGMGVRQNLGEAAMWYMKCVERMKEIERGGGPASDGSIERLVGYCYMAEQSPIHDNGEGFRWMKIAAEKGDACSQFLVGNSYQGGFNGVSQDLDAAILWYRKSAAQGYVEAKNALSDLAWYIKEKEEENGHKGFWDALFT